jgi:guanylate kinase
MSKKHGTTRAPKIISQEQVSPDNISPEQVSPERISPEEISPLDSKKGRVIIISAPSGAGKNTIIWRVRQQRPEILYSVSLTTRAPRPGEIDGEHYHFVTPEQFEQAEARGEFLECNPYAKHRYGTLREPVEAAISSGRDIILEIDVKGARDARVKYPDALKIFIAPPDFMALRERLLKRDDTPPDQISERLAIAEEEMRAASEYDYIVVNDDLEEAIRAVVEIIDDSK